MQNPSVRKRVFVALALSWMLGLGAAVPGQMPKTGETRELASGQAIERQMTATEIHLYKIRLQADEFFQVRVEQKGIDVALRLADASGQTLATMDSPNGTQGFETLSFIAARAEDYLLEVSGFDKKVASGNYMIRREVSRTATTQDRRRVEVEKLFIEGLRARASKGQSETAITKLTQALRGWQELKDNDLIELTADLVKRGQASADYDKAFALVQKGTKESLQAALPKFEEARRLYSELDDKRNEASALNELGSIKANLGEREKALEYFNRALALNTAAGYQRGEARILNNLGNVYSDLGDNQKALDHFNRALALFKAVDDKRLEATTLSNLASIYNDLGEKQKAVDYYNQSLPSHKAAGNKWGEAAVLSNLGSIYNGLGERQKALDYYQQSLPLRKATGDKRGEADVLKNLASIYDDLGEQQKALDYYHQSLPLRKATGDRGGEALALGHIGLVYLILGENQKALDCFNQALVLFKDIAEKDGEATTHNHIGTVHSRLGNNQKALDEFDLALTLYKAVGNKSGEATTLHVIGKIYSDLGENQKALDYHEQSLGLRRGLADKHGEAVALTSIGSIYNDLGEREKALEYLNQGLRLFKEVGNKNNEALALVSIGVVYSGLGDEQKALDYYNKALPLYKAVGNKVAEAYTLSNISTAHLHAGEYQKALEYYSLTLPLFKETGNKFAEAGTLNNIGGVYKDLREGLKAISYYKLALPLFQAIGNQRGEATTLNNIGRAYDDLGDRQKALEYYNQSLPLRKNTGDRRGEANTLNNLMYVWGSLNNRRLAILYGKQSVNLLQSLRADIKGLDKELQQGFLGSVENTYRKLAELLIKAERIPEAEQVLRMLKDEEYFKFVRGGEIASALNKRINLSPSEQAALLQYDKIADDLTRLGNESAKFEVEKNQPNVTPEKAEAIAAQQKTVDEKLTTARRALEIFLEALKNEFSREDKRIAAVEEGLQAEVKGWNDPHVVVISTIVGQQDLSIIVTTSDIQTAHVIPISEEKLSALVGDFRAALTDPSSDPKPAAQKLYDVLIKPLQKDLDGVAARTLVWSLDGILRYAPMSALWDAEKGYLVQRYANVVITLASRGNLALRPEGKARWQALGVGVSKAVGGFSALGNVPGELSAIVRDSSVVSTAKQRGVMTGRRFLDEQFTYDAFRNNLGRFRIVHAATHFSFISGVKDESLESFLLLGNGEKLTLAKIQSSGTIFNQVQLLTLSACDTGYGGKDADGREVEGFGAMAQKKGAKAVLATLWRVNDESTRDLMIEFYSAYQEPNFNKATALRQAQLALLQEPDKAANVKTTKRGNTSAKQFAHPYYWSPFILIGNWQ